MSAEKRRLLYVNPPSASELIPILRNARWDIDTVRNPAEMTLDENNKSAIDLGLLHFPDQSNVDIVSYVHDCLALVDSRTEWIALLSRKLLENPSVQQLIASHFYDFHTLPGESERILNALGHVYGMVQLKRQVFDSPDADLHDEMVGCCEAMTSFFRTLRKVAHNSAPVLITGETGTGKELAARAIHERSLRANGPFVAINCAAIPQNLIQSELFGYERGAFTGANASKKGRIEMANGGTLFLDEVGDLPLDLQGNILRFLQEGQIDRLGGLRTVSVDARVVAATHTDLDHAINEGRFREDLYHRLSILILRLPPLRERGDDVEILARYYFAQFAPGVRRSLRGFSREALAAIRMHSWPGNVRELINRIRRSVVMSDGHLITPLDLGLEVNLSTPEISSMSLEAARDEAERHVVERALSEQHANVSRTAQTLGVSRVTLYRLLEKHGLRARTTTMH